MIVPRNVRVDAVPLEDGKDPVEDAGLVALCSTADARVVSDDEDGVAELRSGDEHPVQPRELRLGAV